MFPLHLTNVTKGLNTIENRIATMFVRPPSVVGSSSSSIPPRNRPIHLSQFAKYLSVLKTVGKISDGAVDDGMSVLLAAAAEVAISFNPK